jgi:hypothetical protein
VRRAENALHVHLLVFGVAGFTEDGGHAGDQGGCALEERAGMEMSAGTVKAGVLMRAAGADVVEELDQVRLDVVASRMPDDIHQAAEVFVDDAFGIIADHLAEPVGLLAQDFVDESHDLLWDGWIDRVLFGCHGASGSGVTQL